MRQQRLTARVLQLAVAGVLIVGCEGGSSRRAAAAASPAVTVRTCSMVGFGGLAPDWRRRALIFGPLALASLRDYTAERPGPPGRIGKLYGAYEIIAIVNAGATPVLSLPRSEWRTVGLLYDPSKFRNDGAYRIQDLARVVRFCACKSPSFNRGVSQFDGGFVVTHAQCVHFLVSIPHGRAYQGEFPAAAPCRRASSS
jgi:hypothetical protein